MHSTNGVLIPHKKFEDHFIVPCSAFRRRTRVTRFLFCGLQHNILIHSNAIPETEAAVSTFKQGFSALKRHSRNRGDCLYFQAGFRCTQTPFQKQRRRSLLSSRVSVHSNAIPETEATVSTFKQGFGALKRHSRNRGGGHDAQASAGSAWPPINLRIVSQAIRINIFLMRCHLPSTRSCR